MNGVNRVAVMRMERTVVRGWNGNRMAAFWVASSAVAR